MDIWFLRMIGTLLSSEKASEFIESAILFNKSDDIST